MLTALLALVGNLFYVVVYTGYLKRSTDQNIVIGGAAGAVPPLVGYAAATGSLALPALWLFLIVFLWTPPHFWALALMLKEHYRAANVPMLPGTRGERRDDAADPALLARARRVHARRRRLARRALHGRGRAPRRRTSCFLAHRLRVDTSRRNAVVLFHYSLALPRAAVRRGGGRPAARLMLTPELERKNMRLGLALFAVFVLLFVGACLIALLYLQVD